MRQFAGTYLASIVPLVMPLRLGDPADKQSQESEPIVGTLDVDAEAEVSFVNVEPLIPPSIGCKITVFAVPPLSVASYVIRIDPSAG